jgi:hypothetical protein
MKVQLYRKQNWHNGLFELIRSRRDAPFEWGKNDCTLFAADCVEAITGVDLAADYRDKYSSEVGAYKLLKKEFEGDIGRAVERFLGEGIPPLRARRGDIVLIDSGRPLSPALAMCEGRYVVAPGPHGLAFQELSKALKAWRIG